MFIHLTNCLTGVALLRAAFLCAAFLCVTKGAQAQTRPAVEYNFNSTPPLVASLESHNGQYLMQLANNTEREFRGTVRLSLGNEGVQVEAGQAALLLPPNSTKLLSLSGLTVQGDQYTLRLFDQRGVLVFYKIAPVRPVSAALLAQVESISLGGANAKAKAPPVTVASAPVAAAAAPPPGSPAVQIKLRLTAGVQPDDPFILAFELVATTEPVLDATLEVRFQSKQQSKPVSVNKHAVVEFNVPEDVGDGQIAYTLKRKDGSVIVDTKTSLENLFSDDIVSVSDIRPERASYLVGDTAKFTFVLEGQARQGYKLEIAARDGEGNVFFNQTLYGNAGEPAGEQAVLISLPDTLKEHFVLEYKLFDSETGTLFDSGERNITVGEKR